jgi:hypothetical protein
VFHTEENRKQVNLAVTQRLARDLNSLTDLFENSYFVNEKILPCIKISNKRIEVKFYYILEAYVFFLSLKYH